LLVFFLLLTAILVPVVAVKVEGAKIMMDVKPDTTYIFPMAVSIGAHDKASDYAAEVYGFGQSANAGSYTPLTASEDTGAYSARGFVTVTRPLIHLNPGERVEFNATIKVPANAGDGGRYAIIHIHPVAAGTAQASFTTAVIVPVMLTISGSKITETGTITDVSVGDIVAGKPITVTTTLKNTGNHHYYKAASRVTVTDSAGATVGMASASPVINAVIPGQSVRFPVPLSTALPPGTYTVKSEMLLESSAVLDSRSTTFTVSEAYVPPFTAVNVTLRAENPAILRVPEGTVSISFPQGAVLGETTVSVVPVTGPLPALPAGAKAGTTAFSVFGLSGLLTKDATVTVRYAAGDLAAAGGDAKKLALARYDQGDVGWTLLQTTADTNAKTLTTTTNRFSTWAVVAVQGGVAARPAPAATYSPGPDPLLACSILGLAVLAWGGRKRA
jgi:hypothetical protein